MWRRAERMRLERVVKGFASHRRIQILELLEAQPELTLQQVANTLRISNRTASEHIRKAAASGLILKQHRGGREVHHRLSARAIAVLQFLRSLDA